MKITFITGNEGKWKVAADIFTKYGIELDRVSMDTPEIQSLNVEEVSQYSAKYACDKLNKAVITSDIGYYIEALNGFPGPFIKFINKTLTSEQILDLMHNQTNRKMVIKECLTLAIPNKEPVSFICELNTTISTKTEGKGFSIDNVMILEGFNKPRGTLTNEQAQEFFSKSVQVYYDLAEYLK